MSNEDKTEEKYPKWILALFFETMCLKLLAKKGDYPRTGLHFEWKQEGEYDRKLIGAGEDRILRDFGLRGQPNGWNLKMNKGLVVWQASVLAKMTGKIQVIRAHSAGRIEQVEEFEPETDNYWWNYGSMYLDYGIFPSDLEETTYEQLYRDYHRIICLR